MQISGITLARVLGFVELTDLNPRGTVYYPALVRALVEELGFVKFPQKIEDFDEQKGVEFLGGTWKGITVEKVMIYNNGKGGIYLTPPTPRCSVLGCERGLPEDFARVGTALQPRGGLRRVSRSSALAGRMGLSTLRRSRGLADSAESLALRPVPV